MKIKSDNNRTKLVRMHIHAQVK